MHTPMLREHAWQAAPRLLSRLYAGLRHGAGDSDEGDNSELTPGAIPQRRDRGPWPVVWIYIFTRSYADRSVAGARRLEALLA